MANAHVQRYIDVRFHKVTHQASARPSVYTQQSVIARQAFRCMPTYRSCRRPPTVVVVVGFYFFEIFSISAAAAVWDFYNIFVVLCFVCLFVQLARLFSTDLVSQGGECSREKLFFLFFPPQAQQKHNPTKKWCCHNTSVQSAVFPF